MLNTSYMPHFAERLPVGLTHGDLPVHHRGPWTTEFTHFSPDGAHFVTLYNVDEVRMGLITASAVWGRTEAPCRFLGALTAIPLSTFVHWIDDTRFALKLAAFQGDWIRPMVVFDVTANSYQVLPFSNDDAADVERLDDLSGSDMRPFSEIALAAETDLLAHI